MRHRNARSVAAILLGIVLFLPASSLSGYSVLSHEELVDISWDSDIKPALLQRFPAATSEDVATAHAYAYGGSVIQDLGYYPFGNREFTYLLHYVRTGDFVSWMLRDARDINEFAFALGALSHYAADVWGHPAVNAGVGIEYPNLRNRYGKVVTYEENPTAHLKTEFSFDVVQIAKQRYISKQYHDFIGFKVAEDLLERAFKDTYGIDMDALLRMDDLTIGTYRFSVARVIPEMTQVALASRKQKLSELDDKARREFLYRISQADYEKDFGSRYRKPGPFARFLSWLFRVIPKVGPLRALGYKDPTPQTEDLYIKSMDRVVHEYHRMVQEVNSGRKVFPNRNMDTSEIAVAGHYRLADQTYAKLVRRLSKQHFKYMTPSLKENIVEYFASGPVLEAEKREDRKKTEQALAALKEAPTSPPASRIPDKKPK